MVVICVSLQLTVIRHYSAFITHLYGIMAIQWKKKITFCHQFISFASLSCKCRGKMKFHWEREWERWKAFWSAKSSLEIPTDICLPEGLHQPNSFGKVIQFRSLSTLRFYNIKRNVADMLSGEKLWNSSLFLLHIFWSISRKKTKQLCTWTMILFFSFS